MTLRQGHGVLLTAVLAVLSFNLAWPVGWTRSSPLPWDEAGHYQGAVDVAQGITSGSTEVLRSAVFGADQYPPVHSLALGAWMSICGNGVASWLTFGLLVYVLTAVLLARIHAGAGLLFVGLGMFGGLAPSLMVEPLAVLWVVIALRVMPAELGTRHEVGQFALAWVAAFLALMTKYSFGLPLVGAMSLACLVRWERRMSIGAAIGAAMTLSLWAMFLSVQDQGWDMFRSFARNRANSIGASPMDRLVWYLESFRHWWLGSALLGLGLSGALVLALVRVARHWRDPRNVAPIALLVSTLTAFALHPYLLGRNLVVVVVAAVIMLGHGMASLNWSRRWIPLHAALILLGLMSIPTANRFRTSLIGAYYPECARDLEPVSRVVGSELGLGELVRVVGTFNEFGPGWIQLLRARQAPDTAVAIDAPYPLSRSRERLDPRWDAQYRREVEGWREDGTDRVVGLELTDDSPFLTEDYERWGRWKRHLVRALDESEGFARVSVDTLHGPGVVVSVFEPLGRAR